MLESGLARSGRTVEDLNGLVPFGRIGGPWKSLPAWRPGLGRGALHLTGRIVEITGAQAVA